MMENVVICKNCDSKNIERKKDTFSYCIDCGQRLNIMKYEEESKFLGTRGKRIKMSQILENDAGPMNEASSILILKGFQQVLQGQTDDLANHICNFEDKSLNNKLRHNLKAVIGKYWLLFLHKWLEEGWGDKKKMQIVPLSKKLSYNRTLIKNESFSGPVKTRKTKMIMDSYNNNPKPKVLFKFDKKDNFPAKKFVNLETGELSHEMTLSFLMLGLYRLGIPFLPSQIRILVKKNIVEYLNLKKYMSADVVEALKSIQLNNSTFLLGFFEFNTVVNLPRYVNFARCIIKYIGHDVSAFNSFLFLPVRSFVSISKHYQTSQHFLRRLINVSYFFEMEDRAISFIKGYHFSAIIARLIILLEEMFFFEKNSFSSTFSFSKEDPIEKTKINYVLKNIPRPDRVEEFLKSFEKTVSEQEKRKRSIKGGVSTRKNNAVQRISALKESLSDLLDIETGKVTSKGRSIEAILKAAANVLKALRDNQKRVSKENCPKYHLNDKAELRKKLKPLGRVANYGTERFIRKWENENGKLLYDCVCGTFRPSLRIMVVKYHIFKMVCDLGD